jgi:hypothetical protein
MRHAPRKTILRLNFGTNLGDHSKAAIGYHFKTGLYEKVINVKADVAAVLVSATKHREWW